MRRKKNRILKRLVLGFAVAALIVPSAAMAAVDEGGAGQPNSSAEVAKGAYVPFVTDFPKYEAVSSVTAGNYGVTREMPSDAAAAAVASNLSIENVRLQPRTTSNDIVVKAGPYGMPHATPTDWALMRGDGIEIARLNPRSVVTADIENVRLQPRTTSTPEVVAAGFDWGDAGIGAGLVLGLLLIGGAAFYGTRHLGKVQTA
jgi:hypothetical protein